MFFLDILHIDVKLLLRCILRFMFILVSKQKFLYKNAMEPLKWQTLLLHENATIPLRLFSTLYLIPSGPLSTGAVLVQLAPGSGAEAANGQPRHPR